MANWALFCRDVVYGRYNPTTMVTCSKNAAFAGNVVDGDPSSVWYCEDTSASTFAFGLVAGAGAPGGIQVKAVALCNHNMSGETLTLYSVGSLTTTPGTQQGSWTIPDNEDTVFIIASPSVTSSYWQVGFSAATTSNYVGEISLLDDDYHYELDYPSAPRYPIALATSTGAAVTRGGGVPREQTRGGSVGQFGVEISMLDMSIDTPGVGRQIYDWHRLGLPHRVWVTDDTFGSDTATIGRGTYCFLEAIQAPITAPSARGVMSLALEPIPYDRQA